MTDLQHLTDLGAGTEARALKRNADAAMLRTAIWGNATHGGIRWSDMHKEHQQALR